MTDRDKNKSTSDSVVGQYFGFFDGVSKQHYQQIVSTAPFDQCNLLILAFVHAVQKNGVYIAQFTNWRDNSFPYDPKDSDLDRVKLIVQTARQKNPSLKILMSLGWGTNDAGNAASTPGPFADSVGALIQTLNLDGLDVDFESTDVQPGAMLTLAQAIASSLSKVTPKREMVMTITPAQTYGLNQSVLQAFTYTMPQSYGNNPSYADTYAQILGSYDQIVYGLDSEGPIGQSDNPQTYVDAAEANNAAGIFAWRLDNDSLNAQGYPTFATGIKMWQLMNSTAAASQIAS
ncbi:MAG TPA: glycoside hydrolase family 18 protein [Candidatus Sulfotelmatobacter sp.]